MPSLTAKTLPKSKQVRFSSRAHLLVELGERLVTQSEAAVAELVKNAYDADATVCWVALEGDDLVIADNGHGMDEDTFVNHWMVIASDSKRTRSSSRFFKRPLAGSKGLGRLSVAYLGQQLVLTSQSYDREGKKWMELQATFNWSELVEGDDLADRPVTYTYSPIESPDERRTTLRIKQLRRPWRERETKALGTEVASLCDPLVVRTATSADAFDFMRSERNAGEKDDKGFDIRLPAGWEDESVGIQEELLSRKESTLEIRTKGKQVEFQVTTEDPEVGWTVTLPCDLSEIGEVSGIIHHIPQENTRFRGLTTMDGRTARAWLRKHSGVRVFYQGFRVFPYGSPEDDWLYISLDLANSRRQVRGNLGRETILAREEELQEVLGQASSKEQRNVMLHIPRSTSTLGAIHIMRRGPEDESGLIPAANRQGFVQNPSFSQLHDVVRTGLEIMGAVRTELVFRKNKARAQAKVADLQESFKEAIARTRDNPQLSAEIKAAWVADLRQLEKRVVATQQEAVEVAASFESVGLLGSLAAFLTHEMTQLLNDMRALVTTFGENRTAVAKLGLTDTAEQVELRVRQLSDQADYVALFMQGRSAKNARLKVRAQANLVIDRLNSQVGPRGIEVANEVPANLETPPMSVAVLSGVLMNLYTNAAKWVIDEKNAAGERRILFSGEDNDESVVIRVSDTGPGIDKSLWQLVFLPGFTTVSRSNPFYTGMGMGLHIVKRLLGDLGGQIKVVPPLAGYKTTFEVRLPKVTE